jgi:hypothetical protein
VAWASGWGYPAGRSLLRLLREALDGEGAESCVLVAYLPCVFKLIRLSLHLHRVEAVELVDRHPRAR